MQLACCCSPLTPHPPVIRNLFVLSLAGLCCAEGGHKHLCQLPGILYYKPNIPLALIEAKDNSCSVGDGIQQGLEYAGTLDIPFVFSQEGAASEFVIERES